MFTLAQCQHNMHCSSRTVSKYFVHAGNALIVVYGPAEVKFTLAQLRLQWTTTSMIVFIIVLGALLGALAWGKQYVARLRAEAQTASVRVRWRAKSKKEPQYLIFCHALLFSAYAGLIGECTSAFGAICLPLHTIVCLCCHTLLLSACAGLIGEW